MWSYSTKVTVQENSDWLNCDRVLLICDGLDTIAHLTWNGELIGKSDNQFVRYVYDIPKDHIKKGEHALQVDFLSATLQADKLASEYPYVVPDGFAPEQFGERNRNFVRKEQCSFSWDWGPCFVTCGIWKDIYLVGLPKESLWISDCTIDVSPKDNDFLLDVGFFS